MPGRGWDYANQNLELLQGGMAAGDKLLAAKQAQAQQDAPASPIEQMLGGAMAQRVHELLAGGMPPKEVAIRVQMGDPSVVGPQGGSAPGMAGPSQAAPSGPPQTSTSLPMMGPGRAQARGINPMGGMSDWPVAGALAAGRAPAPAPVPQTAPPPQMGPPMMGPGTPPAPGGMTMPPVLTRRDYGQVMAAGDTAAKFMPRGQPGLTYDQRIGLEEKKTEGRKSVEADKQAGNTERTEKRIASKEGIANADRKERNYEFENGISKFSNAWQLAQSRFEHLQAISTDKTQGAEQIRIMGQVQQQLGVMRSEYARMQSAAIMAHDTSPETTDALNQAKAGIQRMELVLNDLQLKMKVATSVSLPGGPATNVEPKPNHGQGGPLSFGPQRGAPSGGSIYSHQKTTQPQGPGPK
jgi:hypothetical protein